MLMSLIRVLEDAGVRVDAAHDRRSERRHPDAVVTLVLNDVETNLAIEVRRRAPYPGEITTLDRLRTEITAEGIPTLVAPYISEATGRHLTDAGWCWADDQGNADLRTPGLRIQRRTSHRPENTTTDRLPSGTGSLSIIRNLITTGECPGPTRLAHAAGVTQPRASQVLDRLERAGLVDRTGRTSWTVHRAALLDAFLSQYRGPGGSEHLLYTIDPIQNAAAILAAAHHQASGQALSISGDMAADRIAPWRRPTILIVYAPTAFRTEETGMVEALGPDDANVIIRYPHDRSLFVSVPGPARGELRLADPTQIIWDLINTGGTDRQEAADKVTSWLLSH